MTDTFEVEKSFDGPRPEVHWPMCTVSQPCLSVKRPSKCPTLRFLNIDEPKRDEILSTFEQIPIIGAFK